MCGGTGLRLSIPFAVKGLSPRVRGNHAAAYWSKAAGRSIPACAGEPPSAAMTVLSVRVYPRVCGGTLRLPYAVAHVGGLSPRVRGNPLRPSPPRPRIWSIPACAGEPGIDNRKRGRHEVYPRVCGGTLDLIHTPRARPGLSPRVRGNPPREMAAQGLKRSIPACAGEPGNGWISFG